MAGKFSVVRSRGVLNSRSGSVLVFVLMLGCFLSIIATLFVQIAIESVKYRRQMNLSTDARVEAYSFLDAGLAFLDRSAKEDKVPKVTGSIAPGTPIDLPNNFVGKNSKVGKLIFDREILGGKDPVPRGVVNDKYDSSCLVISNFLALAVGKALKNADGTIIIDNSVEEGLQGLAHRHSGTKKICLQHNGFTIEYTFEDLSNKIPLCKPFYELIKKENSSFFDGLSNRSSADTFFNSHVMCLTEKEARNGLGISEDNFKKYFTVEPCAIDLAMKNNETLLSGTPFRLNLLTADKDLLDKINSTFFTNFPTSGDNKKYSSFEGKLNDNRPEFKKVKKFCSTDVSCFSLRVRVSKKDKAFTLVCYCTCGESPEVLDIPSRFNCLTVKKIVEI